MCRFLQPDTASFISLTLCQQQQLPGSTSGESKLMGTNIQQKETRFLVWVSYRERKYVIEFRLLVPRDCQPANKRPRELARRLRDRRFLRSRALRRKNMTCLEMSQGILSIVNECTFWQKRNFITQSNRLDYKKPFCAPARALFNYQKYCFVFNKTSVDVLKDYINFFLECVRSRIFEYMEMQFISNFYT